MKYLKLLVVFLKSSLLVDLEYRTNFIVQALMGVFQAGITFISVALFFWAVNHDQFDDMDSAKLLPLTDHARESEPDPRPEDAP